jgi:hypothetical protein
MKTQNIVHTVTESLTKTAIACYRIDKQVSVATDARATKETVGNDDFYEVCAEVNGCARNKRDCWER